MFTWMRMADLTLVSHLSCFTVLFFDLILICERNDDSISLIEYVDQDGYRPTFLANTFMNL